MQVDCISLTYVCLQNDHLRGDQWNGEDLSIVSVDDKPLPVSPLPPTPDFNQSTSSLLKVATSNSSATRKETHDDSSVNPTNLKRTLTNPSISSEAAARPPELTASPGYRAAEAYVRPAPVAVAGLIAQYGFDLRQCQFNLTIQAPKVAAPDAPTVVFLPEYHFPKDACVVEASSGKWEISNDEEETALVQRLRWWHGEGEQTLRITGVVRKYNAIEGSAATEEAGYYEQCNQGAWTNCNIM